MLEAIRRNSRSTIIYVLFGVLIAVFVINFGPGSEGCGGVLSTSYAARVAGSTISEQDYRLAYIAIGGPSRSAAIARELHLKEFVMDKLIERELLAQEAELHGFNVSTREVEDLLATGKMYLLGIRRRADEFLVEGQFDYKRFQSYVEKNLGVNVKRFIDIQRRELLGEKVKQALMGGTKVTPAEAKTDYEQRETQSNLEFVRFTPRQYEAEVEVTPAELADYQAKNADEIKKQYEDRAFLYQKVEKQARTRLILVALAKDEKDAEAIAAAEKKAGKLKAQLGGKGFAALAREASEDEATRARGGDLGWRKPGFTGLPKDVDDKVFAAKAGEVLGPLKTDRGYELILVEGFREGDIPLAQVAPEIAEDRLRSEKAKALAKAAAQAALATHAPDRTLAIEFPKKEAAAEEPAEAARPGAVTPVAEETGSFQKRGELIPQLGVSAEVMRAAFSLKAAEVGGPFDVAGTWVIVRVKERKNPDPKYFEEHKDDEMRQLERQKWADIVEGYVKQRCVEAHEAKRITWNQAVLSYDGADGPVQQSTYVPCGNRL